MEQNDKDIKKYNPKTKSGNNKNNWSDDLSGIAKLTNSLSDEQKDLRRREENYLFRGYGTMMDTSEAIDFSEGRDSD